MSKVLLDQQLLKNIKRDAKKKRREDGSLRYRQWLNVLSATHGYATFGSLKRRVEELEQQARDDAMAGESAKWVTRFAEGMVWGNLERGQVGLLETLPLPVDGDSVPWPDCFNGSNLFSRSEGPRRELDGMLDTFDASETHYRGEELRAADDRTIFMVLMAAVGGQPCGRLVELSTEDLDRAAGLPLPKWGIPVQYDSIAKTLWRLVHCELKIAEFKFKGPLLAYADARQAPDRFAVRFNPDFANLYYPILAALS